MKFGVTASNSGRRVRPDEAIAFARAVEALGFESLWTVEHVAVPGTFTSRYPYTDDGSMPGGPDQPMADPLVWLSFVAANTERLRLGTALLVLPLHHPVRLAKAVATLDLLSGGRVLLGVGIGWLAEEARLVDAPWERRAARSEEQIGVLRALWREERSAFNGRFYALEDVRSFPKPHSADGPPVIIGGHSDAVARRAGRIGDGFLPAISDPDEVLRLIAVMRRAASDAGRDPDSIEVTCSEIRDVGAAIRLAEAGVARINVVPRGRSDEIIPKLERYLERIAGPLADRGL